FLPLLERYAPRSPVRQYFEALLIVHDISEHDLAQNLLVHSRVGDRNHAFDAPIEIARHHVGRADVYDRFVGRQAVAIAEAVDAAVLQEATDDRLDTNILRKAGHLGTQAADAAHNEVDVDPGSTGVIEGVDDDRVNQRVHFHPDLPVPAPTRVL